MPSVSKRQRRAAVAGRSKAKEEEEEVAEKENSDNGRGTGRRSGSGKRKPPPSSDDEVDDDEHGEEHGDDAAHGEEFEEDEAPAASPRRPRSNRDSASHSPLRDRHTNPSGKPAEAGVIQEVYVENFMCHRKLSVKLCRNVNFIHGQNGSGKSAILAAIQVCLGAGARRTHRARNLKDLVRKEAGADCTGAKLRVTLLNRGADGYRRSRRDARQNHG